MTTEKKPHTFRTRRTPAEMAAARAAPAAPAQLGVVPSMTDIDGPEAPTISAALPKDISADQVQLMRQRAQERKEKALQDAAAQASVVAAAKLQRWLYNSNTENISEFPEGYMVVEDGYFEYTPPASFPFTDEDKEVHLEFCRSRVNTKPIDGLGNAKLIRNNAERMLAQTTYMPPQPQTMNNGVLTVDTSI